MTPTTFLALLALQTSPQGIVHHGKLHARRTAPSAQTSKTPQAPKEGEHVVYRRDAVFAVWDARGLSIRNGEKRTTTRLPDIALTPKLFTRDEIMHSRELIRRGIRSKNVIALSGSKRVGDDAYFLGRWEDADGTPWLEALVRVNLRSEDPQPELVGRFEGLTVATKPIDDKLAASADALYALTKKNPVYGIASYDLHRQAFAFKDVGSGLVSGWQIGPETMLVQERTSYASRLLCRVHLGTGARRELAESRGTFNLLDYSEPLLVRVSRPQGEMLRNVQTGAEVALPRNPVIHRTAAGIQIAPKDKPEEAVVYDPQRLAKTASAAPHNQSGRSTGSSARTGI